MPPELIPGIGDAPERVDHFPADMWCFGETIFYLLTRKRAFGGDLLLLKYWQGGPFPKEPLLHVSASAATVNFVQQLMVSVPTKRLTAEMAAQHELMKTEPAQKVDQNIGETSDIKEDASSPAVDEQASGRWTTLASLQQSAQPLPGLRSTMIAPSQKPRTPERIDYLRGRSHRSHRQTRVPTTPKADTQTQKMHKEDSRRTSGPQLTSRPPHRKSYHSARRLPPTTQRQGRSATARAAHLARKREREIEISRGLYKKPKKETSAKLNIRDWLRNIGSSKRPQRRSPSPTPSLARSRYPSSGYTDSDNGDSWPASDADSYYTPSESQ